MMFNDTSGMKIYDNGITKQKIDIHGHNEQPRSHIQKDRKSDISPITIDLFLLLWIFSV